MTLAKESSLDDLRAKSLDGMDIGRALLFLGEYLDAVWDLKAVSDIDRIQKFAQMLATRSLSKAEEANLNYIIANSWAALRIARDPDHHQTHSWERPEMEKELIFLRRSVHSDGFDSLPLIRKVQALTNLGGNLSATGRIVEAIPFWDRALSLAPTFGMALGNRGIGLKKYAEHLHEKKHSYLLAFEARRNLEMSCKSPSTQPETRPKFEWELSRIRKLKKLRMNSSKISAGKTPKEQRYRKWCLERGLFLNALNDLGKHPLAMKDVFRLPSIISKAASPPAYFGFFNILKQEFITARYLLFVCQDIKTAHFADRDVLLYNTLDYPSLSFGTDLSRLAFRSGYSILDKVSYFLWDYFKLENKETQVNFRSVWYKGGHKGNGLHNQFQLSKNWPLRGLFWLSKDLFENEPEFQEAIEPEAQQLHNIRNHLEHKYLSLHQYPLLGELIPLEGKAMALTSKEFEKKVLIVLQKARAAIMYLSMAIHVVESKKADGAERTLPRIIGIYEDEWKIR